MKLSFLAILILLFANHIHANDFENYINSISKDPNIKYLVSTTRDVNDAMYLKAWTMKIQRFGNLNYHEKAKRDNLEGQLIIYVSIAKDGS